MRAVEAAAGARRGRARPRRVSLTPASGVTAHIGARPVIARVLLGGVDDLVERVRRVDGHEAPAHVADARCRWRGRGAPSGASRASRRMPAGSPDVHTVMARASMASAHGSHITRMASRTRSRFASGSPIPWKTTPCTRCPGLERPAHQAHLLDDLPGLQVAREAEPPGRAERARQRAPRLRADARAEAPRALERDAHGLDDVAVGGGQRELHERVEGAAAYSAHLERGHAAAGPHGVEGRRAARPRGLDRLAPVDGGDDLARLGQARARTPAPSASGVRA